MRHGDYDESKLNRLGKKQIKYSACYLKQANISKIYSSPITRCLESSKIVNKILNKEIAIDSRLSEREKIASMRGEDDQEWFDNYLNINYSSNNPEGAKEFFDRIKSFVEEALCSHDDNENILIVGHSSTLYALTAYFYGAQKEIVWMAMGNGSIVCFETKKK